MNMRMCLQLAAIAAIAATLALVAWLANGRRSRPQPLPITGALVPKMQVDPAAANSELGTSGTGTRGFDLGVSAELVSVEASPTRAEPATDGVLSGPVTGAMQLEELDRMIARLREELDALPEIRVPIPAERAYTAYSTTHGARVLEIAAALRAAGRAVDGYPAHGAYDPSLIIVHHSKGDDSSHVVLPCDEFPGLYVERAKLQRLADLSGIQANREMSTKHAQLSTLLDVRTRLASNGR